MPADLRPQPDFDGLHREYGQMNPGPARIGASNLPPAFLQIYLVSDTNGVPFTVRSLNGEAGAPYDPSLGTNGGYHLVLALDGAADGVEGDIDAIATFDLL